MVVAVLIGAASAQTAPICTPQPLRWSFIQQKVSDSSLNGTYYYSVGNEGLSRVLQGTNAYLTAVDTSTTLEINWLCDAVERQQSEIAQLKSEVEQLKAVVSHPKTVARNRPSGSSGSPVSQRRSQTSSQALVTSKPE